MQARDVPDLNLHSPATQNELGGSGLGVQLKSYFDNLTEGPIPDRLLRLTEQLEAAFERGDLRCAGATPRRR